MYSEFQGWQSNICLKVWYPMQRTSYKSHIIPITLLYTHIILVILMVPKYWKICIHIATRLQKAIRVKGQTLTLRSNQVVADPLYCIWITPTWIVDEHGTLVHCKLDVRPGAAGDIHQHSHNRSILPRIIKGSSISVFSKSYCCCCIDRFITI